MKPLVSIIVPFYNVSQFFDRSARSILGQTYPETEFIFVDDGSPDDCAEQLQALLEGPFRALMPRVTFLRRENRGVSAARAEGIALARGTYILCVDSDDWMEPDMVQRLVETAEKEGSDLVYCDFYKEYAEKTRIGHEAEYTRVAPLLTDLLRGRHFHGMLWNKLIRRELFLEHTPCQPVVNVREDLLLVYQMIYHARKAVHLRVPLYHYRKDNAASILHQDKMHQTRLCAVNQLHLYDSYRDRERPNPVSIIRHTFLLQTLWYVYKTGSWDLLDQYPYLQEDARKLHFCAGLTYHPFRYFRIRKAVRERGMLSGSVV